MFEQSTLPSAARSKRLWATSAGAIAECLLLLFAIAAPMIWPEALPRTNLITALLPPVPSGHSKPDRDKPRAPRTARETAAAYHSAVLVEPVRIHSGTPRFIDPPIEPDARPGVAGGIGDGPGTASSPFLDNIIRAALPPPLPHALEPPKPTPAAAAEPRRVRLGGRVKMAEIVRRIEPQYPALAKQMRVEGEVQLTAVIGIDGRIRELRVSSGHPLLARAALDAVSQWIYRPTTLNDEPVEVIAPITVTFRLR